MRVLLVAPPGAGKSTHGRLLSRTFGIPFISSGELLRAEIDGKSAIGEQVSDTVADGRLVPDELMTELVRRRLTDPERLDEFVLDGFPRTRRQAEIASQWPGTSALTFTTVLHLEVPEPELARRIDERSAKSGRADDTKAVWERRLSEYKRSVEPLLDFYRQQGIVQEVDASGAVDVVQEKILLALEDRGTHAPRADDELWQIVTSGHGGVLATLNADGSPQLSNIYYLADPVNRVVRFSTTADRIKGRNLLRDPRAALHVSGRNFLNFAVASGEVTLAVALEPDGPAVDDLFEIHRGLGANPTRDGFGEEMVAAQRTAVRLRVTHLYGQVLEREPRSMTRDGGTG